MKGKKQRSVREALKELNRKNIPKCIRQSIQRGRLKAMLKQEEENQKGHRRKELER